MEMAVGIVHPRQDPFNNSQAPKFKTGTITTELLVWGPTRKMQKEELLPASPFLLPAPTKRPSQTKIPSSGIPAYPKQILTVKPASHLQPTTQ